MFTPPNELGALRETHTSDATMAGLKSQIDLLIARRDLTRDQAETAMRTIIEGVDPCQTAALLVLLQAKGETPSEVAGMVSVMREHMVRVTPPGPCIDIVGTGGDGHHTVNFSTAASVVAAACGACVAKHGNRSVSSQCGSADVLETLGVVIAQPPAGIERCLADSSIAFMFACAALPGLRTPSPRTPTCSIASPAPADPGPLLPPLRACGLPGHRPGFHPAMKNVVPVRKALGVRTVFNILGPMLNPAACGRAVIGVYSEPMVGLMAHALHELGAELTLVVHCGGLDELAPIAVATVATVTPSGVSMGVIDPFLLGFKQCTIEDLKGGSADQNAEILMQVFAGKLPGAVTDTVVLNAGAGLYVAGVAASVAEGCKLAAASIAAGKPLDTLSKWVAASKAGAS